MLSQIVKEPISFNKEFIGFCRGIIGFVLLWGFLLSPIWFTALCHDYQEINIEYYEKISSNEFDCVRPLVREKMLKGYLTNHDYNSILKDVHEYNIQQAKNKLR